MPETVLEHALYYAGRGFRLLPLHCPMQRKDGVRCSCGNPKCESKGKHPFGRYVPHGLKDASNDPEVLRNWFGKGRLNIGIVTGGAGGFFALDVDPRHEGDKTLAALEEKHGQLPLTWRFLTGGGGEHILFRPPANGLANSAGKIGKGLDIRGDGGYLVAPPSIHESGRAYAISVDHHPDDVPLAEAPAWLLALVERRNVSPQKSRREWRELTGKPVPEGERNHALARLSGLLIAKRIDPYVALDLVVAFNETHCAPPLGRREVVNIVANIVKCKNAERAEGAPRMSELHDYFKEQVQARNLEKVEGDEIRPLDYSDDAMAVRFTEMHGADSRYVAAWGKWLLWNGQVWRRDETLEVSHYCRALAREAANEIARCNPKSKLAAYVANSRTVKAMEYLARMDRVHAATSEQWDLDPWLLNTPGGTLNLKSGELQVHDREDYCTKMTAAAPAGECPNWLAFLDRALEGKTEIIAFCRRMLGYSMTGAVRDHAVFFLHGMGGNGKGLFLNTWERIMNDYAQVAPLETFVSTRNHQHPTDIAMMKGARLILAQETEEGERWAKRKINSLTGGDKVTARFMGQDFFSFIPQFKIIMAGNHKPSFRSVDDATRRRFHIIPFGVKVPEEECDTLLPEKFMEEWPGILLWALGGCLEWQRIGLAPPKAIREATDNYLEDEDSLGRFLAERCDRDDPEASEDLNALFGVWKEWCAASGEYAGTDKSFSQNLAAKGLKRDKHPRTRRACFKGVRLLNLFAPPRSLSEGS